MIFFFVIFFIFTHHYLLPQGTSKLFLHLEKYKTQQGIALLHLLVDLSAAFYICYILPSCPVPESKKQQLFLHLIERHIFELISLGGSE